MEEVGETTLVERRFAFRPWWWLATAAIVFLALWGWRELGMRVAREHVASREAEVRQLSEENARLTEQLARFNREMAILAMPATTIFSVAAPPNASARVFIDPQGRALVVVAAAKGEYELSVNSQKVATVEVPASGQKTMLLDHLPPEKTIQLFSLAAR